ncbi:MAG: hypothetical protein R8G66_23830 [Cytophagales bacterium]|nr:hypothetical protein [Cytophagales bacterium]
MSELSIATQQETTILWDQKINLVLTDQEELIGNLALVIAIYEKCWFKATDRDINDYLGKCLSLKERQSNEIMSTVVSSKTFSSIKNSLFVTLYPASQQADDIVKDLSDEQLVMFCRAQENSLLKSYEKMIEFGDRSHRSVLIKQLGESRRQIHRGSQFL